MGDARWPIDLDHDFRHHFTEYGKFSVQVLQEFRELEKEAHELQQANLRLKVENEQLQNRLRPPPQVPVWRSMYTHPSDKEVHGVAVSADSKVAASVSWAGRLSLLDLDAVVRGQRPTCRNFQLSGGLYAVAFAKTSPEIVAASSADKSIYLYDHITGEHKDTFSVSTGIPNAHTSECNGLDFHHSQSVMCTASDDKQCLIWDFKERKVLRTLEHPKEVYGCSFFQSLSTMQFNVATCARHTVRVYDMRRSTMVKEFLNHHSDEIIGLDFSAANGFLASGADDGRIVLLDHRTWRVFKTIDTRKCEGFCDGENKVKRLRFSPDGSELAAGTISSCVLVYDGLGEQRVSPAKSRATISTDQEEPTCVFDVAWAAPRPGSEMLVAGAHDMTTRIWAR
eukprot:TRINITY_DN14569_c0_g1_i1.p1 TRINITY_DN14569_c0_g1~~TRINITY_DN14569_c0_g1_i1.p1  ORF type:complete len:395 (+),score=54.23 TRINITY_DN14569_c0_g1_i1:107-1291(+)